MIRVDFAFDARDRQRTACDVIRKHYLRGRRVIVYVNDERALARFEHLLWGFEPTAFIPHVRAEDPLASTTPVILCHTDPDPSLSQAGSEPAWLINLAPTCPPNSEQFTRILEIVSDELKDKEAARNRWRWYQSKGYELHAHSLQR